MTDLGSKAVILAVDDTPENLDVVKGALGDKYVIKAAINGMSALKIAEKTPPDLSRTRREQRAPIMNNYFGEGPDFQYPAAF